MKNQPFFTRHGDAFVPTEVANGPWDPESLHGRVIIGLLAFEIEIRNLTESFRKVEPQENSYLSPTALKVIADQHLSSGKALGIEYPGKNKAARSALQGLSRRSFHSRCVAASGVPRGWSGPNAVPLARFARAAFLDARGHCCWPCDR